MTVNNLSNLTLDEILDCFFLSFENYYVKMPTDRDYYEKRWGAAKVDFRFSYGMFDNGKLVGFIIHAFGNRGGKLTAFNTGTGVIPEYRGKRIVKSIYAYALEDLKRNGFEKCTLEVIIENEIAIRSYESVGFNICKNYNCYIGNIETDGDGHFELKEIALDQIDWKKLPNQEFYSWDFQKETILEGKYTCYQVLNNKRPESFFIINPENKYLAQFDLLNSENKGWKRLFSAIKQISDSVKIINVDDRLKNKLEIIDSMGFETLVNQYEMELKIVL